ncbi:hypothetical protein GGI12_000195 [Dipsacomyces acuminosporus]|nr:hypothetical protein GGI12_000195 [Dipsacomyces acuminosporus]
MPPGMHGLGQSRTSDAGNSAGSLGLSGNDSYGGAAGMRASNPNLYRSKTVSTRQVTGRSGGGGGASIPMPPLPPSATAARSNMSDILERSKTFTSSIKNNEDEDEDLERVVRKSGQSGLVNAYGIPIRPTTGYSKRASADRKSLSAAGAPSSARPSTSYRSSRGDGNGSGRESLSNLNDKIRVCVRKRPLNGKEKEKGEKDIVPTSGRRSLSVMEPKVKVDMTKYIEESRFVFDEVFNETADNVEVYERTAKPLVEYIFHGGNATCFAYGQTGSGKTFTMMDMHCGLYIQAAEDIFSLLELSENKHLQAFVTFYEIYLTNLFDLLNDRKKLFAREDANQNVCIQGIREVLIQSPEDLMSVFEYGNNCRSTGSTGANSDSSRSHAILQIALKDTSKRKPVLKGKLSFIDLAGNERGSDRGDKADKQTMMEGSEINKSLLALKECIRALDLNKKHQPFRQSKLTQVLKDSFIGNSRACMVATISPNISNCDNTLNTLRYADRVKAMKSSSNTSADTPSPVSDNQREGNDYYSNEYDANYEGDSGDRVYDEGLSPAYGRDSSRTYDYKEASYHRNSREMFREEEEDEFADMGDVEGDVNYNNNSREYNDDYLSGNNMHPSDVLDYDDHVPSHQQPSSSYLGARRASYEEKLEQEIAEETPSILDEQPSFLDGGRNSSSLQPPPHIYGSPAAKSYVSSRLTKSPTSSRQKPPSRLTGMLLKSRKASTAGPAPFAPSASDGAGRGLHQTDRNAEEEVGGEHTRRVTRAYSRNLRTSESAVPGAISSDTREHVNADQTSPSFAARQRANTQGSSSGNGEYQSQTTPSPYASALSLPPNESAHGDGQYEGMANGNSTGSKNDDIDSLVEPFGGLRVADVDTLVKLHRAEIRSTTEACKEETMLISAYTTFSYAQLVQQTKNKAAAGAEGLDHSRTTSWQHHQSQGLADKYHLDVATGAVTRLADGVRFDTVEQAKMNEAIEYLEKLDEVLARKQQLVVDLRAEIRKLVWNSTKSSQ